MFVELSTIQILWWIKNYFFFIVCTITLAHVIFILFGNAPTFQKHTKSSFNLMFATIYITCSLLSWHIIHTHLWMSQDIVIPPFKRLAWIYPAYAWLIAQVAGIILIFISKICFILINLCCKMKLCIRFKKTLIASMLSIACVGVYSSEYSLRIKTIDIPILQLPKEFHDFKIVAISDIHCGYFMGEKHFQLIAEAIQREKPDLIAIVGDLINYKKEEIPIAKASIQLLPSTPKGTFIVPGNHDHNVTQANWLNKLQSSKVSILRNQHVQLSDKKHNGRPVFLVGLDYPFHQKQHPSDNESNDLHLEEKIDTYLQQSFKGIPNNAINIILSHSPDAFNASLNFNTTLVVAGHTHGGQFSLGRFGSYSLTFIQFAHEYVNGLYTQKERFLYVTPGIGHWFPFRLNCPREISIINLVEKKSKHK